MKVISSSWIVWLHFFSSSEVINRWVHLTASTWWNNSTLNLWLSAATNFQASNQLFFFFFFFSIFCAGISAVSKTGNHRLKQFAAHCRGYLKRNLNKSMTMNTSSITPFTLRPLAVLPSNLYSISAKYILFCVVVLLLTNELMRCVTLCTRRWDWIINWIEFSAFSCIEHCQCQSSSLPTAL